MSFSPWAILAIALVGVIVIALLAMHRWRTRADMRKAAATAAAKEKTDPNQPVDIGGSNDTGTRTPAPYHPPADLGDALGELGKEEQP
ncbi:hypothetical protein NpNSSI1_00003944 [Neofusicoccum parvum]|nr:hypothetical protein NpNSSI1_00003944 [Neofusicoccum parvum]